MVSKLAARPDGARADMAEVARLWERGALRPAVHARFGLDEVVEVHRVLDGNLGRVVAVP